MSELIRMPHALLFVSALVFSAALTPLFRLLALRTMVFVHRPKAISIETHVKPIPVGGGLAIFLGVFAALWLIRPWSGLEQRMLLAGTVLVFFGLLDDSRILSIPSRLGGKFLSTHLLDSRALSSPSKLVAQIVVASLVVLPQWPGGPLEVPQLFRLEAINQAIAIVWIVGMMNAINFLDIMDGLAAGTSAVAALGFFLLAGAIGAGQPFAFMAIALVGGTLGFLFYNFQPARVFMGDTGSQFLGLTLSVLALLAASSPTSLVRILAPLTLVGIPLFEITFTIAMRILTGKPPWKGSKDHYPLRMFQLGFSVRQIVVATYAVGLGLALAAMRLLQGQTPERLIVIAVLTMLISGITLWLSQVKVPRVSARPEQSPPSQPGDVAVRVERSSVSYPTSD